MAWSVKTMAMAESTCALLPGLPQELALLCFSKLPIDAVARCRAVSRSWASALLQYPPPFRLPQALACFCAGRVNATRESSMAWLLFFRSDLQCRVVPFYDKRTARTKGMHVHSSYMQVIPTGTNLLLVQSKLTLTGEPNIGIADSNPCVDPGHTEPGLLQAFDLWQMQWCKEARYGVHRELVPGMWPMEMWGLGGAPHVVVVKDEAYAIGERSEVMRWRAKGGWENAGRLPNLQAFESVERWFFRLVSMGEDELWVVLLNKDEEWPWLVFSCKPHLSNDGLHWEHLPFTIPCGPRQGIVSSTGICI